MWLEFVLFLGVFFLLIKLLKPKENYWKRYGVRQMTNATFLNKIQLFLGKTSPSDMDQIAYERMSSSGDKFCGLIEMGKPVLLVKDLEIVKKIFIKDFDYFVDRRFFASGQNLGIINKMVGNLEGDEWKGVRSSLSPTFTTGKIRRMMQLFNQVSLEWVQHFKESAEKSGKGSTVANIPTETTNFAVDVIAAGIFGMNNVKTISNPNSTFAKMVGRLSDGTFLAIIKFLLAINFPKFTRMIGLSVMDMEALKFLETILTQGIQSRMTGTGKFNDFMQIIVEARKGALKTEGEEISDFEKDAELKGSGKKNYLNNDEICVAQMMGFFFAGFSTTSNFIAFVIYSLAAHPKVQEKLREEVDQLFEEDNEINYDKLNGLAYLDMVFCEVLRKYSPVPRIERVCTKNYHDSQENYKVAKDVLIAVPAQAIHNDKRYYEKADEFWPEHFTPENKGKRNPYAFLPFGAGPRNCIGMRFAMVESKAAIAQLLHNFIIEPTEKTPLPPKVRPVGMGISVPADLELKFVLRK